MGKIRDRAGDTIGYDHQSSGRMLELMLKSHVQAVSCVCESMVELEQGAQLMAAAIQQGGRLIYCGAGSSGLMALADSLELPGTFGIDVRHIRLMLAGGRRSLTHLTGAPDDDTHMAEVDFDKVNTGADDCLICVSASGSTAYTLRVQQLAKGRNTPTI